MFCISPGGSSMAAVRRATLDLERTQPLNPPSGGDRALEAEQRAAKLSAGWLAESAVEVVDAEAVLSRQAGRVAELRRLAEMRDIAQLVSGKESDEHNIAGAGASDENSNILEMTPKQYREFSSFAEAEMLSLRLKKAQGLSTVEERSDISTMSARIHAIATAVHAAKIGSTNFDENRAGESLSLLRRHARSHVRVGVGAVAPSGKYPTSTKENNLTVKKNKKFAAREVPWASKVNMFDALSETQEKERRRRIKARAEETLIAASAPHRMTRWAQTKGKAKQIRDARKPNPTLAECTFTPRISGDIPDFPRKHSNFEEKRKKLKPKEPTQIKPFKFAKRRPGLDRCEGEDQDAYSHDVREYKSTATTSSGPPELAKSTKKFEDQLRKLEAKAAIEEDKRLQAQQKKEKKTAANERMKHRLKRFITISNEKTAAKVEKETQDLIKSTRERDEQYTKDIEEIYEKVQDRPLLIELDKAERDRAKARFKALQSIKNSLDAAGITAYERFFDQAELAELGIKIKPKPTRKKKKPKSPRPKMRKKHDDDDDNQTRDTF